MVLIVTEVLFDFLNTQKILKNKHEMMLSQPRIMTFSAARLPWDPAEHHLVASWTFDVWLSEVPGVDHNVFLSMVELSPKDF